MLYHCQVTSLQVVMPPPHQRAPEMRSPNCIRQVKVAEAEVLSVVPPVDPTVAVAEPPAMVIRMKLQKALGTKH